MSYATTGDKPLAEDIEITRKFAHSLETLLREYVSRQGSEEDADAEALLAQAGLISDRLTDIAAHCRALEDERPARAQLRVANF